MVTCYCAQLRTFTAPFPIVILQHPDESRNAIATARMAHLSIENSRLFVEKNFTHHTAVNQLLQNHRYRHLFLFPSPSATDLDSELRLEVDGHPLMLWVLDAKWGHIAQMLRLSENLRNLHFTKFSPPSASRFLIRRQPHVECLSTIESIYHVLDRYRAISGDQDLKHDGLMHVFNYFVHQQLEYAKNAAATNLDG